MLEKISFELACLKVWRFGAKTKAMNAQQRQMFEEDPGHLKRVEHHHEPESTTCAAPCCGQPMVCIGEDVQERHASSAGRILRTPSHPQQVGLQVLQCFGAGASTAEGHREGDAGARSGRPHADQPLR